MLYLTKIAVDYKRKIYQYHRYKYVNMTRCYTPMEISHLEIIQTKVMELIPTKDLTHSHAFYLDDNIDMFLSIPELRYELEQLSMINFIFCFGLLVLQPFDKTPIHTDTGPITYSFNIPISGCENSKISWYQSNTAPRESWTAQGKNYFVYDPLSCQEISQFDMKQPAIINVKIPHRVINLTNQHKKPRVTLLTKLKTDIGALF